MHKLDVPDTLIRHLIQKLNASRPLDLKKEPVISDQLQSGIKFLSALLKLIHKPDRPRTAGEQEIIFSKHQNQTLANDAPIILAEDGMLRLSGLEVGPAVGRDVFEKGLRLRTGNTGFEERRPVADVTVRLPGDALVDPARVFVGFKGWTEAGPGIDARVYGNGGGQWHEVLLAPVVPPRLCSFLDLRVGRHLEIERVVAWY